MKQYDLDFFIALFTEQEEEYFSLSTDNPPMDAYQWLDNEQVRALSNLVTGHGSLIRANDGDFGYEIFGRTIKSRVINFLLYVQSKQSRAA